MKPYEEPDAASEKKTDRLSEEKEEIQQLSLEESFTKLEEILSEMESGDIGLEESFSLYKEGLSIVRNISSSIDRVEKDIEILENGSEKDVI